MASLSYKKNFSSRPALQSFYTGGPVCVSPDGTFLACACGEEVKIVDLETGVLSKSLPGDTEAVTAIAISPDGKTLFSASRSLLIKLWDIDTATIIRSWKGHNETITHMVISAGLLATSSLDKTARVWDIEGGFCTHSFRGHNGLITKILFHPDPEKLVLFTASEDSTVRVWDLMTKKCVAVLEKHFSAVTSLAVSADGLRLLSGARDKVVNVWGLGSFKHEATVPVFEAIEDLCILPNECGFPGVRQGHDEKPVFLTAGELGVIRIFSSEGGKCLYKQKSSDVNVVEQNDDESKRGFVAAFLMPDAKGVMCVTFDQRLLFYEPVQLDDGQCDLQICKRLIGSNDEVTDLRFVGKDETQLAVASNVDQVRIYDLSSMTCVQELAGHSDIVLCLDSCLSPQGRSLLASGGKDHAVKIWDVESGKCLASSASHSGAVGGVAFYKKERSFLVSGSRDRSIKVWSFQDVLEAGIPDKAAKLTCVRAAAAHDKDINAVAVAPNDSLVCSGSQDCTARIWKLPELTLVTTLKGHKRGVWSVEFSPVDQCVLTSSGDKTIRIWALSDGSCLKTFEGHTSSVLRASFLSRGTQIISAGADGLLKLWVIKSNECINTFDQHSDKIWALTLNRNSDSLASGGVDAVVNIWEDCTVADEEETAQREAEEALKEQDLANAIADTDYAKAAQLAFELRRPFKLLNVFTEMMKTGKDGQLGVIVKTLDKEYVRLLLEYIREWNSKPKFCFAAQCALNHVFNSLPPSEIIEVPGVSEILEGILPYSQRHFTRINRLERSCYLVDYTLSCMSVLVPCEDDGKEHEVSAPSRKDEASAACKEEEETEHEAAVEVLQDTENLDSDKTETVTETKASDEKTKKKKKRNHANGSSDQIKKKRKSAQK